MRGLNVAIDCLTYGRIATGQGLAFTAPEKDLKHHNPQAPLGDGQFVSVAVRRSTERTFRQGRALQAFRLGDDRSCRHRSGADPMIG